jgi:TPR repeat protein
VELYYKLAADQGHLEGIYRYGLLLLATDNPNVTQSGEEMLERHVRGFEYSRNAAVKGHRDA